MKKSKNAAKRIRRILSSCLALMMTALLLTPMQAKAMELTTIDSTTFRGNTSISTIHIGSDVTEITSGAFRGLMNLRSITVSENNPFYASYSNCLYNKSMTELLCFPAALSGARIPDSVVEIGENALYGLQDSLKEQIRGVVKGQADENLMEWQIPGAHFVHTEYGVKWKNENGSIEEPDTELKKLVASVIDICTVGDMRQKNQLESCFNYFVAGSEYERKQDFPVGEWTGSYATDILLNGKGNCYNYAAAFAYIAKGLGYEARVCTGTVTSSLGGRTLHAWTEVKMGNTWYVFDTEMQDAKGSGYYKQTYASYPAGPLEMQTSYKISY